MVAFNSQIQDANDPDWLRQSRGINTPESDKTWGTLFKGIGDIIDVSTKGAVGVVEDSINTQSRAAVDQQREGYTGALETIAGIPQADRVGDYQPDKGIMDGANRDTVVPADVEAGVDSISRVANAGPRSASKLDPTYYEGRLDMIAKDLRRQYPGFSDYVDKRMAQLTGGNPANEYMRHLMNQINRNSTGADAGLKRDQAIVNKMAEETGDPSAKLAIDNVNSGAWSTSNGKLTKWIVDMNKNKYLRNTLHSDLEYSKDGREINAINADSNYLKWGTDYANKETIAINDGAGLTDMSQDQVSTMVQKILKNEVWTDDAQQQQLGQALRAHRNLLQSKLDEQANKQTTNGSVADLLGKDKLDKRNAQILSVLDMNIAAVESKDSGTAFRNARTLEASKSATALDMWNSDNLNVQKIARLSGAVNTLGGPNVANLVLPSLIADGDKVKLRTGLLQFLDAQTSKLVTQSPEFVGPVRNTSGVGYSMINYIKSLKTAKVGIQEDPNDPNPDPRKAQDGSAYQIAIETPGRIISNPSIPDKFKQNVINGSYGTENDELMKEFKPDMLVDGKYMPGQLYVLREMAKDSVSKDVYKQAEKTDRSLWDNYRGWVEKSHGLVFGNNIRDMNVLGDDPRVKMGFNPNNHHIDVKLDNEATRPGYGMIFSNNMKPSALEEKYTQQLYFQRDQINSGIDILTNVYKTEGRSDTYINAQILNLFTAQSMDVTKGLGLKMYKAVMGANPKEVK